MARLASERHLRKASVLHVHRCANVMSSNANGLFKRLATGYRQTDLESEILEHLRILLNSRQGNAITVPDFGVIDFSDVVHSLPQGVRGLEEAIRLSIERFEPRLEDVRVRCEPEEGSPLLRFEITGRLRTDPGRRLRVETRLVAGGRFVVDNE